MKIKLLRTPLLRAVDSVKGIAGGKLGETLRNVRVDAVGKGEGYVSVTGSNLFIQVTCRERCVIDEPGAICVDGVFLQRFIANLPELPAEVSTKESTKGRFLHVQAGEVDYRLATSDLGSFPVMPEASAEASADVRPVRPTAAELSDLFRKVRFAVCTNDTRKSICGVNLSFDDAAGFLRAVATDGARLAQRAVDKDAGSAFNVIIPTAAVSVISRMLSRCAKDEQVSVSTDGKIVRVTGADWSVAARLVEDVYPDWTKVVPDPFKMKSATVDRELFLLNLERAAAASVDADDGRHVKITFAQGKLSFSVFNSYAKVAIDMDAKYDGADCTMLFNADFFMQALKCLEDSTVTLFVHPSSFSPLLIHAGIPWECVIMPLRYDSLVEA